MNTGRINLGMDNSNKIKSVLVDISTYPCCCCEKPAVAIWPTLPDLPSRPYCKRCLVEANIYMLAEIKKLKSAKGAKQGKTPGRKIGK